MLYTVGRGIIAVINKLWFKLEIKGQENVPEQGSAVLCANHINAYDPVILASQVRKREILFLAKKELFQNAFLRKLLTALGAIPVDREKVAMSTMKQVIRVLKDGKILGIFPEGTRVKSRADSHPHSGFIMFALKTQSPIIPVHIDGVYGFRKKIKVTFGSPIILDEYYGQKMNSDEMTQIADQIMDTIYAL